MLTSCSAAAYHKVLIRYKTYGRITPVIQSVRQWGRLLGNLYNVVHPSKLFLFVVYSIPAVPSTLVFHWAA